MLYTYLILILYILLAFQIKGNFLLLTICTITYPIFYCRSLCDSVETGHDPDQRGPTNHQYGSSDIADRVQFATERHPTCRPRGLHLPDWGRDTGGSHTHYRDIE